MATDPRVSKKLKFQQPSKMHQRPVGGPEAPTRDGSEGLRVPSPVVKWSTQNHASRIKKADICSYLWLGLSLTNLHLPRFDCGSGGPTKGWLCFSEGSCSVFSGCNTKAPGVAYSATCKKKRALFEKDTLKFSSHQLG